MADNEERDVSQIFAARRRDFPQDVIDDLLKIITEQAKTIFECREEGLGEFGRMIAEGKLKLKPKTKTKTKSKTSEQEVRDEDLEVCI